MKFVQKYRLVPALPKPDYSAIEEKLNKRQYNELKNDKYEIENTLKREDLSEEQRERAKIDLDEINRKLELDTDEIEWLDNKLQKIDKNKYKRVKIEQPILTGIKDEPNYVMVEKKEATEEPEQTKPEPKRVPVIQPAKLLDLINTRQALTDDETAIVEKYKDLDNEENIPYKELYINDFNDNVNKQIFELKEKLNNGKDVNVDEVTKQIKQLTKAQPNAKIVNKLIQEYNDYVVNGYDPENPKEPRVNIYNSRKLFENDDITKENVMTLTSKNFPFDKYTEPGVFKIKLKDSPLTGLIKVDFKKLFALPVKERGVIITTLTNQLNNKTKFYEKLDKVGKVMTFKNNEHLNYYLKLNGKGKTSFKTDISKWKTATYF